MRFTLPLLVSITVVALAGCDMNAVDVPADDLVFRRGPLAKAVISDFAEAECPLAYYDCRSAQYLEQVSALTRNLEVNCQNEACGGDGDATGVVVDDSAFFDRLFYQCASGGTASILSDQACWNCTEGCGAPSYCPPGATCGTYVLHGLEGSDCTSWACSGAADGWALYADNEFVRPICIKLKSAPPPPPPATPTTIASVVNGHPSLTWNVTSGAVEYVIYRQLDWQTQAEAWHVTTDTSYTDNATNVIAKLKNPPFPAQWVIYTVTARNSGGESGYYWLDRWSY